MLNKIVYLDNNACVPMTRSVLDAYADGARLGNISNESMNADAGQAKKMQLTAMLKSIFPQMNLVYTSGGSESNTTAIAPFLQHHIVCPMSEHSSIIECVRNANVTWIRPEATGHVDVGKIVNAIRENTALVLLQSINSETGAVQKLMDLVLLLGKMNKNIHLHCDHVQGFMKLSEISQIVAYCNRAKQRLSLSVSFHKIGGPIGFGLLASNATITPLIAGKQNSGLRGGTYNISAIYATVKAMNDYDYGRVAKLRALFDGLLQKKFLVVDYPQFYKMFESAGKLSGDTYAVVFSCNGCLPHTIFMALGRGNEIMCSRSIKEYLNDQKVVIGYGAACNSEKAPEELGSMRSAAVPEALKNGFLRISFSCYNTESDVRRLIAALSHFA